MDTKTIFNIKGTHCPACKKLIEKRVNTISGVSVSTVNFETGEMEVVADRIINKDEIQKVLEGLEYKVS